MARPTRPCKYCGTTLILKGISGGWVELDNPDTSYCEESERQLKKHEPVPKKVRFET